MFKNGLVSTSLILSLIVAAACGDDKSNSGGKTGDGDSADGNDADGAADGSDEDGNPDGDPDGNPDGDDASGFECDPKGATPAMGDLLNAPVEDGVEVVVKEPKHPGNPGPLNLP